jgi:hypothetical protein
MEAVLKKKTVVVQKKKVTTLSTRDRIKPRGLAGFMKGKIHYDRNADIFDLGV